MWPNVPPPRPAFRDVQVIEPVLVSALPCWLIPVHVIVEQPMAPVFRLPLEMLPLPAAMLLFWVVTVVQVMAPVESVELVSVVMPPRVPLMVEAPLTLRPPAVTTRPPAETVRPPN